MKRDVWDLLIVGAGPAALAAAVYAGREGIKTLIAEQQLVGGQVATIDRIDNYPGYADGVTGLELAGQMEAQARRFGAKIKIGTVAGLQSVADGVSVQIDTGDEVARNVLLATGSGYRHLGIPGEEQLAHYCATCDGAFYKGKNLVTVGGANSAVQEVLYLAELAQHITMLVRSYIKAEQILQDRLHKLIDDGKVTLLEGLRPVEFVERDGQFIGARATDGKTEKMIAGDGLFVFAGHAPNVRFLFGSDVKLSSDYYIVADERQRTTMPGVWAAGDVRQGTAKQIVTAAADGVQAAINIGKQLRGLDL